MKVSNLIKDALKLQKVSFIFDKFAMYTNHIGYKFSTRTAHNGVVQLV